MNNGTCWDCSYTSEKIGDLKGGPPKNETFLPNTFS